MDLQASDPMYLLIDKHIVGGELRSIRLKAITKPAQRQISSALSSSCNNHTETALPLDYCPYVNGLIEIEVRSVTGSWEPMTAEYEFALMPLVSVNITILQAPGYYGSAVSRPSNSFASDNRIRKSSYSKTVDLFFGLEFEGSRHKSARSTSEQSDEPYACQSMQWTVKMSSGPSGKGNSRMWSINPKTHSEWTLELTADKEPSSESKCPTAAGAFEECNAPLDRAGTATPPLDLKSVSRSMSDLFSPLASPPQNSSILVSPTNRNTIAPIQHLWDHTTEAENLGLDLSLDNSSESVIRRLDLSNCEIPRSELQELEQALAQFEQEA